MPRRPAAGALGARPSEWGFELRCVHRTGLRAGRRGRSKGMVNRSPGGSPEPATGPVRRRARAGRRAGPAQEVHWELGSRRAFRPDRRKVPPSKASPKSAADDAAPLRLPRRPGPRRSRRAAAAETAVHPAQMDLPLDPGRAAGGERPGLDPRQRPHEQAAGPLPAVLRRTGRPPTTSRKSARPPTRSRGR